ncbi:MAG TPA: tetraacyldisaccharide 4'-kinase [Wenzhouxiangella sp.]
MLRSSLADWLTSVWYAPSKPPAWLRALVPMYRYLRAKQITKARGMRDQRPNVPVIVVGNLVVGGSGKTPVVACVVAACLDAGYRVAVISRGYGGAGRSANQRDIVLVRPNSDPKEVGDEPVLLAKQTGVDVWVGRDRQLAVARAVAAGAEVVVSDDGLQHHTLQSSYTMCLIDGERGFGNGYLLPAGPLREPIDRLNSVDQILIKSGNFRLGQPHSRFELSPKHLVRVVDGEHIDLNGLEGQAVVGLCAIAHPEGFCQTLKTLGMTVSLRAWPDHHVFSIDDLTRAHQSKPMVVTQKDWVKIERLALPDELKGHLYVLQVEAQLDPAVLDAVVGHVREFIHHG